VQACVIVNLKRTTINNVGIFTAIKHCMFKSTFYQKR
jgi:hypothetical protein